jgi:hypothetical protein
MKIKYLLTLSFFLFHTFSCNKITPSGFWKNYQKEFIIKNISDQGPWGGHRAIYWKSNNNNTFNTKQIIDFAVKNGWKFVDSSYFRSENIKKWTYNEKNIFPLSWEGFIPNFNTQTSVFEYFPRWTDTGLTVLRFKTGWISVTPGSDDSDEINGFATLSDNKQELTIYHLWGD